MKSTEEGGRKKKREKDLENISGCLHELLLDLSSKCSYSLEILLESRLAKSFIGLPAPCLKISKCLSVALHKIAKFENKPNFGKMGGSFPYGKI